MPVSTRARVLLWAWLVVVLLFLLAPLFVVVPVSFSATTFSTFPPSSYSMRWYDNYFNDASWTAATWLSIRLGLAVTVVSLVCGSAVAIALTRFDLPVRAPIRVLSMTPMIVPSIIVAIAVYSQYVDFHLVNSFPGLVLAHTILALPYVVLLVTNGLQQIDVMYEEASGVMGASRLTTMRRVVIPMLAPSLAAAGVFAFVTSWDEVVMVLFIGGRDTTTLPLKMFTYLKTDITPTIAAVSAMLIAVVVVLLAGSEVRTRLRIRREAGR
jgi:ABC-type spermidine/putrescine transport system permease subunit II